MDFPFETSKATQAACWLIEKAGGQMNVMKLVKLIYLLDRLSLERRGIPVVGGSYFSFKNGPVTSQLLDLVNDGRLCGEQDSIWERHLSDRENHQLRLLEAPDYDELAPSEIRLLENIHREHGGRTQWELVDWCHQNCAEWTPLESGRKSIAIADIGEALGMDRLAARRMAADANELAFVKAAMQSQAHESVAAT